MAFAPRQRNTTKTAPGRGKVGEPRLKASIASTLGEGPSGKKAPKIPSTFTKGTATTTRSVKSSSSTRRVPLSSAKASVKTRTVSATPSNNASSASAPLPRTLESDPSRTKDSLQVAAQLYPWLYMTSSLETTFQAAELSAHRVLHERAKDISEKEAAFADQRVRFDAERRLALLEELASNTLSHQLSETMQSFLRNGDTCDKIVPKALQVGTQSQKQLDDNSNLPLHNDILNKLEHARSEANQLESSVMDLLDSVLLAANSPLQSIFAACLPVLRARTANLGLAQDLMKSSKDNFEMALRLENLRVAA